MSTLEEDLAALRETWRRRRAAAKAVRNRIDPRGMTRPARSPEERAWLRQRGVEEPFTEVEQEGKAFEGRP
jgi:hypothetical protein